MNGDAGRLNFVIGLDNSQLRRDIKSAQQSFKDLGTQVESECSRIDYGLRNVGKAVTAYFTVTRIWEFGRAIINTRKEVESLEISFGTLLGSKPKATAFFGELKEFAVKTPLQLNDIARAAQTLLGFGVSAEKTLPILRQLGDVSMGNAERFKSLALAYAQATSAGRLQGQDLLQMINAGFNPLNEIAKKTGKSIGELRDDMAKGKISAQDLADALSGATAQGGQFHGMLEKQSKGIEGALSKLEGAWNDALNEIGTSAQGIFTDTVELATVAVRNYDKIAAALGVIATAYGINKAALALYATASNAAVSQEIALYNTLLPVKDKESASDVRQISASRGVSQAKAQEVLAVKAQLGAYKEELSARIANLTALKAEINALRETVAAKIANAEIAIALAKEEQALALTNGDLFKSNAAGERLMRAEKQKSILTEREANLSKAASNVQTQINTTTTQANTVATTLNTGAQAAARKQAGLLALAYNSLKKGVAGVTAYLSANPYLLIAAGVTAAAYGIYKLVTYQTDYEKSLSRLKNAEKDFNAGIIRQNLELDRLFARLKNAKRGTDEYKTARDEIMSRYGSYLSKLGDEKTALNDIARAYSTIRDEMRKTAQEKAVNDFMGEEETATAKRIGGIREDIYGLVKSKYGDSVLADGTSAAEDVYRQIINALDSGAAFNEGFLSKFDEVTQRPVMNSQGDMAWERTTTNRLRQYLQQIRNEEENLNKLEAEAERRFTSRYDRDRGTPDTGSSTKPTTYDEEVAELKKRRADIEEEIRRLKNNERLDSMKSTDSVMDAIEQREKELADINSKLGVKAAQEAADKQLKLEKKAGDGLLKLREQNNRDRIALMEDGRDKELAQIQSEYDAKIREIQRQEKEWREAQGGTLTEEQDTALDTATTQAAAKYRKDYKAASDKYEAEAAASAREATDAMNGYLRAYGEYMEKRQAIIDLYNSRIEAADTEGEKKTLAKQMEEELAELDFAASKSTSSISRMFKEMADLSISELKRLYSEGRNVYDFLTAGKYDAGKGKKYGISEEQYVTISGDPEKLNEIISRLNDIKGRLDEARNPFQRLGDSIKNLFKGNDKDKDDGNGDGEDVPDDSTEQSLREIAEALQQLDNAATFLSNSFSSLAASLGSGALGDIGKGLGAAAGVMSSTANGMMAGSMFGPAGMAIGGGLGFVSSVANLFASSHDNKREKRIGKLQDSIEALTESNEELQRALEDSYSVDAKNNLEEQNRNLQQQQALIQQQIAEEQDKKDPDDGRIDEWRNQLAEIQRQIEDNKRAMIEAMTGTSMQEAVSSFSDALVGAWENGTDAARSSIKTAQQLIKTGLVQYLNKILSPQIMAFNENLAVMLEDGFISSWEDSQLTAQAEMIASMGEQFRERMAKYLNIDGDSGSSGSGNAVSGMSQDTGDAIEGRLTAVQISVEAIRGHHERWDALVQGVQAHAAGIRQDTAEIRYLSLTAVNYLETIARNTGELATIKKHLAQIEKNTTNL